MGRLTDKVAVVTGGTAGIGLAAAAALAEEGAHVFVTGRREPQLANAVSRLGGGVIGVQGDVSRPEDLDRLYETVRRERGQIDVLFANAGIGGRAHLGEIDEMHIDALLATNVKGVVLTVQKALPLLRPGSSVILNASIVASRGFAGWSVYSATKAAVRSFARTWAADLRGRDIRVNAISPGVIDTPGYRLIGLDDVALASFFAQAAEATPLGRVGAPEEVAKVVTFLASDDSRFITGGEVFVDGGFAQV